MPVFDTTAAADPLTPGLVVLHGNRLELLAEAVFDWVGRYPLAPLEEEVFLVQSNATAEWLKATLAQRQGVCAAVRTELPARFVWRAYRAMLGVQAAPAQSPLDKAALQWRVMGWLDGWLDEVDFAPLRRYLQARDDAAAGASAQRRWQLAGALADVLDQYQVYRADWLQAWGDGRAVLLDAQGRATPLPADQRWQAVLWQHLLAGLASDTRPQAAALPSSPTEEGESARGSRAWSPARGASRPEVHARFLQTLRDGAEAARPLPRRVVVFGLTHLPLQTLQALMALAARCQVLIAVPNPSRWHWADIIDGREWFATVQRRQAQRPGAAATGLPLHAAHAQSHPLLAAWGRQGRDFMRLLDAHEARLPRIDLFDAPQDGSLLAQVQAAICDLRPLAEHPRAQGLGHVAAHDRSIVFHLAHSPQREVEVLHDQLLHLLAQANRGSQGSAPLAPRQVVVMVPDLAPFEAAIHAVFGQVPVGDARHIPYTIADLGPRGREPLLVALEWLLHAPELRCTASELRDLLEVPALARRFGLADEDLPTLVRWIAGSGVRWGLHADHRAALGLGAAGAVNTWAFGLRRMLMGYVVGTDAGDADIAPYDEIGGLDAAAAGALAELLQVLGDWWRTATQPRTPGHWAEVLRLLLGRLFAARDEPERLALAALDDALVRWLDACDAGGFDAPVPLAVAREAWLEALVEPGLSQRFASGGVTFCTLLPMRAIPFEVVCLLGMNEGDYPRRTPRQDFDLMGLPGQRRAGDRAARDDDRYLLLEAVLAARRVLYVSWVGRSVRDNTPQPPSPLIGELRDYLDAGFGDASQPPLSQRLTTAHPLQPFSRRYFEPGAAARGLVSYAREWRAAHAGPAAVARTGATAPMAAPAPFDLAPMLPLTLARLGDFLKHPVRHHYRWRLNVRFDDLQPGLADEEAFAVDRLDETGLLQHLLDAAVARPADDALGAAARALQRRGVLPLGTAGVAERDRLLALARPMCRAREAWLAAHPQPAAPMLLRHAWGSVTLDDGLDGLRRGPDGVPVRLGLRASRLLQPTPGKRRGGAGGEGPGRPADAGGARPLHWHKLVDTWLPALAAAAAGQPLHGTVVACDVLLHWRSPPAEAARDALDALLHGWAEGLQRPLPVALRAALAWCAEGDVLAAARAYDGDPPRRAGEGAEACLARTWGDFEALHASDEFEHWAGALYGPLLAWAQGCITVEPLPDAAPADDDDDDDEAGDG